MKTFLAIVNVCLALCVAGAVGLLIWQSGRNHELTAANTHLTQQLRASQDTVAAVKEEKAGISEKLATLETMEKELRDRVGSLEAAAKGSNEPAPRPYRVRAFLGRDSIGDAWIIPHNVTRDPDTGRYTFEPVLLIDESAKNHFTVYHTNVVEQETYTMPVYEGGYNYPYYGYPYYYYVTGGRPVKPGRPGKPGRPDGKPERPTKPEPPQRVLAPQPDARAQIFAPPMSRVNARPQVVGRPATSRMNIRVFAP